MDNKPLMIFSAFMLVAFIVIGGYLLMSNPFQTGSTTATTQNEMGDQQAMILYLHNCASCHGASGKGLNGNPSLINNGLSSAEISTIIRNGKGRMPGLPNLTKEEAQKIADFVKRF